MTFADDQDPKAPTGPTNEEKRARVVAARQAKELAEETRRLDAELEKTGEGFFVVKLGPSILWKTYWDSKMTDVDRCDLVTPCIVHPAKEQYLAARGRRQGIDAELTKLLGALNGLQFSTDQGN